MVKPRQNAKKKQKSGSIIEKFKRSDKKLFSAQIVLRKLKLNAVPLGDILPQQSHQVICNAARCEEVTNLL